MSDKKRQFWETRDMAWCNCVKMRSKVNIENLHIPLIAGSGENFQTCHCMSIKFSQWREDREDWRIEPATNLREVWSFTIMEKASTRAFSWLKVKADTTALCTAFTYKNLLRHNYTIHYSKHSTELMQRKESLLGAIHKWRCNIEQPMVT